MSADNLNPRRATRAYSCSTPPIRACCWTLGSALQRSCPIPCPGLWSVAIRAEGAPGRCRVEHDWCRAVAALASGPGKTRRTIHDMSCDGIFTTDSELDKSLHAWPNSGAPTSPHRSHPATDSQSRGYAARSVTAELADIAASAYTAQLDEQRGNGVTRPRVDCFWVEFLGAVDGAPPGRRQDTFWSSPSWSATRNTDNTLITSLCPYLCNR